MVIFHSYVSLPEGIYQPTASDYYYKTKLDNTIVTRDELKRLEIGWDDLRNGSRLCEMFYEKYPHILINIDYMIMYDIYPGKL